MSEYLISQLFSNLRQMFVNLKLLLVAKIVRDLLNFQDSATIITMLKYDMDVYSKPLQFPGKYI